MATGSTVRTTMPDLHTILRAELSKPLRPLPEALTDDLALEGDLGADSIDRIALSMRLEDEFGIRLHDADITGATTVGELCALVGQLTQEAA